MAKNQIIKDHFLVIGSMTGNSLDAADTVLTAFYHDGRIVDLAFHSTPMPHFLSNAFLEFKALIKTNQGDITQSIKNFDFNHLLNSYMNFIEMAIRALIQKTEKYSKTYSLEQIDLIGFSGQTCAHLPPSMTGKTKNQRTYTIQIGDGQALANKIGITTVYDFRSDDLFQGGEGAPLAPLHTQHLAQALGLERALFINGGNTSNLSQITQNHEGNPCLIGWDAGPFNHYPDYLMRSEKNMPFDPQGELGETGTLHLPLLEKLFEKSVQTLEQKNFLNLFPPKSSDPNWYQTIPELQNKQIPFENRLKTAEYFSAYLLYHSLSLTPKDYKLPTEIILFGNGWKNKVIYQSFCDLVLGDRKQTPILNKHEKIFQEIKARMSLGQLQVQKSDALGFNSQATEARLFADLARCRILGKPFTYPQTTGVRQPTICGIVAYPNNPTLHETRWSRATAGWSKSI